MCGPSAAPGRDPSLVVDAFGAPISARPGAPAGRGKSSYAGRTTLLTMRELHQMDGYSGRDAGGHGRFVVHGAHLWMVEANGSLTDLQDPLGLGAGADRS